MTNTDAAIAYIATTKLKIMEIWKHITGYEGLYQVSNMGRIKSLKYGKEKILKLGKNKKGYLNVLLHKDMRKSYRVNRLVAQAFLDNPNNLPEVNHKDEDKTNNRVENLEWCNHKYNSNYGSRINRIRKTLTNRKDLSKPIIQFTIDGELVRKWESGVQIKRELGFSNKNISRCIKRKTKIAYGYKWCYHYKSLWLKKHIPQIKLKKVA